MSSGRPRGLRPLGRRPDRGRRSSSRAPDTVAAVFLEPVQNSGGCFAAPARLLRAGPRDLRRVRRAAGLRRGHLRLRPLGALFGSERYGYQPDIITCAKGLTSGYSPLGAHDRQRPADGAVPPRPATSFLHGYTFGGHPVSCAVAMANLDVFENETGQRARARQRGAPSGRDPRAAASTCRSSATSAATGTSTAIELVKDKTTKETLRRRRGRAPAPRLPVQGAVRRRPLLPGRRPRRPGHPARPRR